MKHIQTYIVDSFTAEAFKGNPAGVCLLEEALSESQMLSIAQELNLSETAFVLPKGDKYGIRYFSPLMEIPLCGHATLAAAKILFDLHSLSHIDFRTQSGVELTVILSDGRVVMEFPTYEIEPAEVSEELLKALGISEVHNAFYNRENNMLMLEMSSIAELTSLAPDFAALIQSHDTINGVLVTAASRDNTYDFYSRYFWPWSGNNEDPVTGATHTFMAPFWSNKLNKTKLKSFQASKRTGSMELELLDDNKLLIHGHAVIVLRGTLTLH